MKDLNQLQNELSDGRKQSFKSIETRAESNHSDRADAPAPWEQPVESERQMQHPRVGGIRLFFVFALLFCLGSFGYFYYSFSIRGVSATGDRIAMAILGASFVTSGEEYNYEVVLDNTNRVPLEKVVVTLSVPQPGGGVDKIQKQTIGTIPSGTQRHLSFPVKIYGAQFEDKKLSASIEYTYPGSRAMLVKQSELPVRIADSPVQLDISGPRDLVVGQEVSYVVSFQSKTSVKDVGLKLEYPDGFEISNVSLTPTAGKYYWEFDELKPGKIEKVTISGVFVGTSITGVGSTLRASVGSQSHTDKLLDSIYAVSPYELRTSLALLNAYLGINGSFSENYSVFGGSDVDGNVVVKNTSDQPISNVVVVASFSGDMIAPESIDSQSGYFDSNTNTLTWSPSLDKNKELALIPAGAEVTLQYTASIIETILAESRGSVSVSLQGVYGNGEILQSKSIDTVTLKQNSRLALLQSTLYSEGPFKNTGATSPVVGKQTQYTIHWVVPRQMAQYSSVTVSGHLPLYVEWLQSKPTKTVSYNPTTRIVTWDIGLVSSSLENDPALYFQVGIKPSRQQIGSSPVLVDSVIVGGKNVDSGVLGQIKKQDHTTTLRSDTIDSFGSVVSGDEADGGVFKNQ